MRLFDERAWDRLMVAAAAKNGLNQAAWRMRGQLVRVGLAADLQASEVDIVDAVDDSEQADPMVAAFPEAAWTGLFADYRDAVGGTTEAPDTYHYFTFALGLGACLGRRLFVYHAVPLYPNFYVTLVGRTGLSRKDTARSRINKLLSELNTVDASEEDPKFLMLPGIGSAEGLIESLGGERKVVVVQEGELLSLMAKARRDATSNLIPHLTALYDCPDHYTLKTRIKPVSCEHTFLSLLAGTTPTWLKRSLTEEHAAGGFANRFMFVFGQPKGPVARPPKVDEARWRRLTHSINEVRTWAGNNGEREIAVAADADDAFSAWYANYHGRASGAGLLPALAVRFQSFAWKLALLYAAQDYADVIDLPHLTPALEVVDWLWDSNRTAFADFVTQGRGMEDAILERIKAAGGTVSRRTLYRALKTTAGELEKHLEPMARLGLVQVTGGLVSAI
jgi:hypothetical protein